MKIIAHWSDKHDLNQENNNVYPIFRGDKRPGHVLEQEALSYAKLGFKVLPVAANKEPLKRFSWKLKASDNPQDIKAMDWANAQSVAVACKASGLLVIDVDVHENKPNGFPALWKLEALYPELEDAPRVDTPSGGQHIYLTCPSNARISSNGLKGIDLKHDGYVLLPGLDNAYRLIYGELEDIPEVSKEFLENYSTSKQVSRTDGNAQNVEITPSELANFIPRSYLERSSWKAKDLSKAVFAFFYGLGKLGIINENEAIAFMGSSSLTLARQYRESTKRNRKEAWLRRTWNDAQKHLDAQEPEAMRTIWLSVRTGNARETSKNLGVNLSSQEARVLRELVFYSIKSRARTDCSVSSFTCSTRQVSEQTGIAPIDVSRSSEALEAKGLLKRTNKGSLKTSAWKLNLENVFICMDYVQKSLEGFNYLALPFRLGKLDPCIFQEAYKRLRERDYKTKSELIRDVLEALPDVQDKKIRRELDKLIEDGLIVLESRTLSLGNLRALEDALEVVSTEPQLLERQRALKQRVRQDRERFESELLAKSYRSEQATDQAIDCGYSYLTEQMAEIAAYELLSYA
jgi:hypothetical protein